MHSDDPAGVTPENEKQPERTQQNFTTSKSALPSSAPPGIAAILMNVGRKDARDRWVDQKMWQEAVERKRANDNRLWLERRHAQLSDAIKDTEYWLTLELTTDEKEYVNQMFEVLSRWGRGMNELLSRLPLSDAHPHWLEYPGIFLYFYRKALEASGERVGEHLGQLADELSSEFAEANKTTVDTWVTARKARLQPSARNQKQVDVSTSTASGKKKRKRKLKPTGPRVEEPAAAFPARLATDKAATKPEPKEPVKPAELSYDEDTQVLKYRGEAFEGVNETQFKVIKTLYDAYTQGRAGLSTKNLQKAIDQKIRIENLFQRKGKPVKEALIDYDRHSKLWRFKPPRNKPRPN